MALIQRGTKASAGGGTAFVTGTTASASEVNTDFDTIYNEVNGSLDETNIEPITDAYIDASGLTNAALASAADIALTKLADISGTAAAHDDTTAPGDSSSHTLPTTLSGEIQQLRYVIERQALGLAADRVDGSGTGTTFWGDLPARGPNLIENPTLAGTGSSVPQGWTDLGTGTPTFSYVALSGATLTEGTGKEFRIQAGSAAVAGIRQTVDNLKASTRYLVVARARITTNAAHLVTVNADATSSFRDIDDTTSSTSYVTLKGVIQTDSSGTDVTVRIRTNGASGDDVRFAFVGMYECPADFVAERNEHTTWVVDTTTGNTAVTNAETADIGSLTVTAPNSGTWQIECIAMVPVVRNAADGTIQVRLYSNINGGGAAVAERTEVAVVTGVSHHVVLHHTDTIVSAGDSYVFTVRAEGSVANVGTIPGTQVIGVTSKSVKIRARFVRVGG